MRIKIFRLLGLVLFISAGFVQCKPTMSSSAQQEESILIDPLATQETINLYKNLKSTATNYLMFGHQDDMAYGVGWKKIEGKSDVKDITGSYPAVHGWDLGHVGPHSNVAIDDMRRWMVEIYERGGINTLSFHWDNFTSKGNAWDTTNTVKYILPGGKDHQLYVDELDGLAEYLSTVKSGDTPVPMIFRPLHEHNGDWFWWGKGICTEEEYIALWKFTVYYMRETKGLHNLIYCFSPDASRMNGGDLKTDYLYGYPGDEYVDMLGIDDYWNVGRDINPKSAEEQEKVFIETLELVTQLADEKAKVAAITETGLESITNPTWFSDEILNPMKKSDKIKMSYVLVWRNDNPKHHYAPYPGHPAVEDFKSFCADEKVLLEKDLKGMYSAN